MNERVAGTLERTQAARERLSDPAWIDSIGERTRRKNEAGPAIAGRRLIAERGMTTGVWQNPLAAGRELTVVTGHVDRMHAQVSELNRSVTIHTVRRVAALRRIPRFSDSLAEISINCRRIRDTGMPDK